MTKANQNLTYLVVGLGRFGTALSERLAESGAHVMAVDKQRSRVEELSEKLEYVAQLDATDESALLKIGANDADVAIVCLGEKVESTILATAILKDLGVPKIIARANDELQAKILGKIGAHKIVSPETEMGRRTADLLQNPWLDHFAQLGEENLIVGKIDAQDDMIGKSLKQLALPGKYGTIVTIVERAGRKILPSAELVLEKGDRIWLFGEKEKLALLLDTIQIKDETKDAGKTSMEESQ